MSEEEREPLLSDADLRSIDEGRFNTGRPMFSREDMRDFYEALITSGELRVVKTAEVWHPSVPEDEWRKWLTGSDPEFTMLVTKCCNRNPWTPPWLMSKAFIDNDGVFNRTAAEYVCPGCGAKIINP